MEIVIKNVKDHFRAVESARYKKLETNKLFA